MIEKIDWQGKPYYSADAYFKAFCGGKCYKISVDAGCTCPNRDGTLGSGGCIFCSAGGSGDFSVPINIRNNNYDEYVDGCIETGKAGFKKLTGDRFVIYFQAFTNTYGEISHLKKLWLAALTNNRVVGISVATRPDCMGEEVIDALYEVKKAADELSKFVWLELGLQTMHEKTAEYIRRHFSLTVYEDACGKLDELRIPYIVHVILGLPGETKEMMMDTVRFVCSETKSTPFGIKLQLLHVLKGTDLAADYEAGMFETMELDEYIELVCDLVEIIPDNIVIHRITGDGPAELLISPRWSTDKKRVLNALHKRMKERGVRQGSRAEI